VEALPASSKRGIAFCVRRTFAKRVADRRLVEALAASGRAASCPRTSAPASPAWTASPPSFSPPRCRSPPRGDAAFVGAAQNRRHHLHRDREDGAARRFVERWRHRAGEASPSSSVRVRRERFVFAVGVVVGAAAAPYAVAWRR
jgi:hypothetical protein